MAASVTINQRTAGKTWSVRTLAGQNIELQDPGEQKFYKDAQKKYITENKFDEASDLRALDRLIFLECLMHRWQTWLASGRDYDGLLNPQQEEMARKSIKETTSLISTIQNDLGLTKTQREKDAYESVGAYIQRLQQAAKAHGVRREKQLTKSLDLMHQLFTLTGSYRRSTETERRKLGLEDAEQIVDWVEQYMRPEFDEVDQYFRDKEQRFFVGQL